MADYDHETLENDSFTGLIELPVDINEENYKEILTSLGADSSDIILKIYRVNAPYGKLQHCLDTGIESLEGIEDSLRDEYGAGDYKIKIFTPNPNGRGKSVKKIIDLGIAKRVENIHDKNNNENKEDTTSAIREMMNGLLTSQQSMMNGLRDMQMQSESNMKDLMIQVLSNANSQPKNEQPSMFEMLKVLKELMPEPKDPTESILSLLGVTEKVKEFVEPAEKSEFGEITSAVGNLIQLAKDSPKPYQNNMPLVSPEKQLKDSSNIPIQNNVNETSQQKGDDMNTIKKTVILNQIASQLPFYIQKAANGKPADLWADVLASEIPKTYAVKVQEFLTPPTDEIINEFVTVNDNVNVYRDWFVDFVETLKSLYGLPNIFDDNPDDSDDLTDTGEIIDNNDNSIIPDTVSASTSGDNKEPHTNNS